MDNTQQTEQIQRIYDQKRDNNVHIRKQRIAEIYEMIPEYTQLDKAAPDIIASNFTALLQGDISLVDNIKSKIKDVEAKKKALLEGAGFPTDYLDPIYSCKDCKDTGFIGNKRCQCYNEILLQILYKQSNLSKIVELENFDTFDINYYPDDYIDKVSEITPRDNIIRVLNFAKSFTDNFNNQSGNMLIYGHSGVGKTFLSHCIADKLLKKGYSVIYLTSYQLFDILETKVFHPDDLSEINSGILSMLYTCDLLIIDDLGTEMTNKFTEVQLFRCIQERLQNECSTIISTNLSFDDIKNIYSERIFSRLTGCYKLVKILGSDIRIQKAIAENGGKK